MAQALGIFTSASGLLASTLGLVNFGLPSFNGDTARPLGSGRNPATVWIAAGVDYEGGKPGFGHTGGIMPNVRLYSREGELVGRAINKNGVWPGDTNYIVVPQTDKQPAHYALFSGNFDSRAGYDFDICISWATISWPSGGIKYAWSGGWGHACEEWGAQWYYGGTPIPGSDHVPDCIWVYSLAKDSAYPPGFNETSPPVQGFHVNWLDMQTTEDDPRLGRSASDMCDSRSFRLYKNPDPEDIDLHDGDAGERPPTLPTTKRTTTTKKKTTATEQPAKTKTKHKTSTATEEPETTTKRDKTTVSEKPPAETSVDQQTTNDQTTREQTSSRRAAKTKAKDSTKTKSTSQVPTATPSSSPPTSSQEYITRTVILPPAAAAAAATKERRGQGHGQHHDQKRDQENNHSRQRGQGIAERYANVLVINDRAEHTAEGLCGSAASLGPSFADARGRMYCDMETKTLHPFCGGGSGAGAEGAEDDGRPCFDFEGSMMLRGPGVQKRQAPRVQDWRV